MAQDVQTHQEIAVIDIGSNSVRLVIYQTSGAHFTPVFNEKILAGLGRDLKATGRLSEAGRQKCLQALLRFQRIIKSRDISKFIIGATAAMRVAQDAPEFLAEIHKRTGLIIEPISGVEEARLSAMGVLAADKRHEGLAADLGGASLELVQIANQKIGQATSLPLGPFDMVKGSLRDLTTVDFKHLRHEIEDIITSQDPSLLKADTLFLIGGAWRNLMSVHQQRIEYPMRTLQDYRIMPDAAAALGAWAYHEGRDALLNWPGMRSARAETLPYSGLMLECLIKTVQPKQVIVSIAGLREGMVYDALTPELQARDALFDGCRDFAYGALQAEDFADPLWDFIMPVLRNLPPVFETELDNKRMIKAACLLAGLGKNLHPDYRPELVFADVLYMPVAGLTHNERAFLALILFRSYTHKRVVPNPHAVAELLTDAQQNVARIIGEVIRLSIIATGRSAELLSAFELNVHGQTLRLSVLASESALITDQVIFRLERLGGLMGYDVEVDTHKV